MKKRFALLVAGLLAIFGSVFVAVQPASAAVGLHISGRNIVEANGSNFIIRGVSHAHVWYPSQTSSFANIKSLGANTVRVVLGSGQRWGPSSASDVSNVISLCKQNRLICVLEVHDTTGYGEEGSAATLDQAVTYWLSIASALQGQENYVIINIGNEPYGNNNTSGWTTATRSAIQRLRAGGLDHLIMVDAPNWGQDWSGTMRDNARTVAAADPAGNTVFSIHMYGVYDTAAEINAYFDAFATAGLPLVVGEFGHNHSDGNPDEDTIMAQAQTRGIGYIGWSWSGNSGGVEYLDMVTNFNVNQLTSWGERIFNGANGIKSTAREASIYSGATQPPSPTPTRQSPTPTPTTQSPSPTPTTSSPGGTRGCTATYTVVNSWPGGFQGEVRVTAGSAAITGWTVTWTYADGQTISQAWNATVSGSPTVTARNLAYNGNLGAGDSTTFGFVATQGATNSVPSVSCTAS